MAFKLSGNLKELKNDYLGFKMIMHEKIGLSYIRKAVS